MPSNRTSRNAAKRRNRLRVIDLVKRVGRERLIFTVYDLHRAQRDDPSLELEDESRLSARLHQLAENDQLIVDVTDSRQRDDWLAWDREQGESPLKGSRRYYVLRKRHGKFLSREHLTGLDRAYLAVWVACRSLGEPRVPTLAVTRVLRSVPDLKVDPERQTTALLRSLRSSGFVTQHRTDGRPSIYWEPAAEEPDEPRLRRWTAEFRALDLDGLHVLHAGHTTETNAVEELVRLAVRSTRSKAWPAGRPVHVRDIRAEAGEGGRAGKLFELLRKSRRQLGGFLADVSRPTVAGEPRKNQRVVRVRCSYAPTVFYDLPDEPGFDRRGLYVHYIDVRYLTHSARLRPIEEERRLAVRAFELARMPAAKAIAAVRVVLTDRELTEVENVVEALLEQGGHLSDDILTAVQSRWATVSSLRARTNPLEWVEKAEGLLGDLGFDLETVAGAPRPLLTPDQYARWLTDPQLQGLKPATFANRRPIRMFDNPNFVSRSDDDPVAAAPSSVDRVEALVYGAESSGAFTWTFLRAGANLLGRAFRFAPLVREVLAAHDQRAQRAAFAALALLGDEEAANHALAILANPQSPTGEIFDALSVLLVLRRIEPGEWPSRLRNPRSPALRKMVRDVALAARSGRWLGQR